MEGLRDGMDENVRWLLSTIGGVFAGFIGALLWVMREFKDIREEIAESRHHMRNEMHVEVNKADERFDELAAKVDKMRIALARKQIDNGGNGG
jgi:hypothetical protein